MIRENASTNLAENALNQTHSRCVCFEAKFDRAYYRGITESKRIRDTGYLPAYSTSEFIVIMGEKQHFVPVQERWVEEISVEELARYGPLAEYMRASAKIPGWLRGEEAKEWRHWFHRCPIIAWLWRSVRFLDLVPFCSGQP